MTRLRDLGVTPGFLPTGPLNAITDVPGVKVGHTTLIQGEGRLIEGEGPVRTGCTAILPHGGNLFREKVAAAVYTINGFGKAAGFEQIRERGLIETPILLTNTLNVGKVADALVAYMLAHNPEIGLTTGTVNPVVGECNDSLLSDLRGRHVSQPHVWAAIESAQGGAVVEGNVGAGTGTACYQFKGGIGTSSRRVGEFTVGALVQSNFGARRELRVLGAPIGMHFLGDYLPQTGPGSIMMVLATDAPMTALQLRRLAARAAFGLARTGTVCHDGSGDFVIAFSTANPWLHWPPAITSSTTRLHEEAAVAGAVAGAVTSEFPAAPAPFTEKIIDQFFTAAVESIEEAVLNSLVAAETMTGRDGNTLHAIPLDRLAELLRHYHVR
ncbi:MAG: P1 family peptidase [bacterium]|nr:P1 family peptidase [bacterium]